MTVSLNREGLKSIIRARGRARLAERIGAASVTHTNTDGRYTPSEWWESWDENAPRNRGVTSATLSADGLTITLRLNYGYERIS